MTSNRAKLFVGISELVQPRLREEHSREALDLTCGAGLLVAGGRIVAAGYEAQVSAEPGAADAERIDLGGRAVIPGLVDSHTHVAFAGDRIDELSRRVRGESYEQIARAGGGIARSAALLAQASEAQIVAESRARLSAMLARGTTTVEVKSGYGLVAKEEAKQLRAIAALARSGPPSILATALAHVVPPTWRSDRSRYVEQFLDAVVAPAAVQAMIRYVDVFVDGSAFAPEDARAIAARSRKLGLALKLHVDQLAEGGGAALAAELGALSADHLEYASASGRRALAHSGTVATILPGCRLFPGKGPWPDGRALRDAGCEVAVATDCNPGTSMVLDLGLCATLAASQCGLTLEEALWAVTRGGAAALGLADRGGLRPGERADFVVVDHADWRAFLYRPGTAPIAFVMVEGERCALGTASAI